MWYPQLFPKQKLTHFSSDQWKYLVTPGESACATTPCLINWFQCDRKLYCCLTIHFYLKRNVALSPTSLFASSVHTDTHKMHAKTLSSSCCQGVLRGWRKVRAGTKAVWTRLLYLSKPAGFAGVYGWICCSVLPELPTQSGNQERLFLLKL